MVILQLFRWSFHTKKLCGRLLIEVGFYSKNKNKKSLLSHPLGGNARRPSITRWKARGGLIPIGHNWTFSVSLTVETLYAEICRSRHFSKGSGSLWAQITDRRGHAHQPWRAIQIIFGVTVVCPISLRWHTRISHLYIWTSGRFNKKKFFRKIANNPDNSLFDLSPPPPHDAVIL